MRPLFENINFSSADWRQKLAYLILYFATIFSVLGVAGAIPYFVETGVYTTLIFDFGVVLFTLFCLKLNRPPFKATQLMVLVLAFGVSTYFHVALGPGGARPVWLVLSVFTAAVFYGLRGTLSMSLANALLLIGSHTFLASPTGPWSTVWHAPLSQQIMNITNTLLLPLVIGVTVALIIKGLESSLQKERESRNKYELLVDNLTEVIWVLNLELEIVYISPSVRQVLGVSPHQAEDIGVPKLATDASLQKIRAMVDTKLQQAQAGEAAAWAPVEFEGQAHSANGVVITTVTSARLVPDEEGKARIIVGVTRDISEKKKQAQRQAELEKQLQHAQKMEAIGLLAGGVAHDFNNLLCAIIGNAELARDSHSASVDESKELIEEIYSAATRAAKLTNQLLAFSSRQNVEFKRIDLGEHVQQVLPLLKRLAGKCRLEANIGSKTFIQAEPSQLEQVLVNLIVNARDASAEGDLIFLEVNHSFDENNLPQVELSVTDRGQGIPKEIQDKIYEPFFTTKERGKGTGLGLASVYGIAQKHKASLILESEMGKGSKFTLQFPSVPAEQRSLAKAKPLSQQSNRGSILVVDDDPSVRALSCKLIENMGYRVLDAALPSSALALLNESPGQFDLLFTDVIMPEMNGPELALKARKIWPSLAVLYTSGYNESSAFSIEDSALLLPKPFRKEALEEMLEKALESAP